MVNLSQGGEEEDEDTEFLSPRAQIYRSKLIDDFRLAESIGEQGTFANIPKYYANDFIYNSEDSDFHTPQEFQSRIIEILRDAPTGLVRFSISSGPQEVDFEEVDRRKNRLGTRWAKRAPVDLWCHYVVDSIWFNNFILFLIVGNSLVLGAQAELGDFPCQDVEWLRLFCETFDYFTLWAFCVEIALKWGDSFWVFWKNPWNCFDFIVTIATVIPEGIMMTTKLRDARPSPAMKSVKDVVKNLRAFRVFRMLKLVTRFEQVRLIALAITKAFKEMVFITMLLIIFLYIFGLVGLTLFEEYTLTTGGTPAMQANREKFGSISYLLATLVQLFTLDHWYDTLQQIMKEDTNQMRLFIYIVYIVLWICIASFVFENIFIGIMVNNFQNIRQDLCQQIKEMEDKQTQEMKIKQMGEDLEKQNISIFGLYNDDDEKSAEIKSSGQQQEFDANTILERQLIELDVSFPQHRKKIMDQLMAAASSSIDTVWPRDTLFRYLFVMEQLADNVEERDRLVDLANKALLKIHDVKPTAPRRRTRRKTQEKKK